MPSNTTQRKPDLELLDHGWRHFTFHAQQRLSIFNFYIVLCGLLVAAWATVTTSDEVIPVVGIVLSLLLSLFSYVFWRLDQRNGYLTKQAERVIEKAENRLFGDASNLFCEEMIDAPLAKTHRLTGAYWSHGRCLRFIFISVGLIGIAGAVYPALKQPEKRVETSGPPKTSVLPKSEERSAPMPERIHPPERSDLTPSNSAVTK